MSTSHHTALQSVNFEVFVIMIGSYTSTVMLCHPSLQSMDFESFFPSWALGSQVHAMYPALQSMEFENKNFIGLTLTCPCRVNPDAQSWEFERSYCLLASHLHVHVPSPCFTALGLHMIIGFLHGPHTYMFCHPAYTVSPCVYPVKVTPTVLCSTHKSKIMDLY